MPKNIYYTSWFDHLMDVPKCATPSGSSTTPTAPSRPTPCSTDDRTSGVQLEVDGILFDAMGLRGASGHVPLALQVSFPQRQVGNVPIGSTFSLSLSEDSEEDLPGL